MFSKNLHLHHVIQDSQFFQLNGFYITEAKYILRSASSSTFWSRLFNTFTGHVQTFFFFFGLWLLYDCENDHRPEVLESVFYAWSITGDSKYQEFAWKAFQSLQASCKAPASYSSIDNVNSAKPNQTDNCESFLSVGF